MADNRDVEQYLTDCVQLEPMALQEEYVRIAPDLAYWNQKFATAQETFLRAKYALDELEAKLYIEHRERLVNSGAKFTEALIDSTVRSDPRIHDARDDLVRAESDKWKMNGVVDAVRTKRDMLVSLGAHVRAEMQGDPSLRHEAADVRARKAGG
jgi:hypothetical protein